MAFDVANGVNRLTQGTGSIYLAYAGVSGSFPYYQPIETTMYYGSDNVYGDSVGKSFNLDVVGNNSLPWFVSGSEGYVIWDITASLQRWSGSNPSGVTLSGDTVGAVGAGIGYAGLSASFDSQNLTGASQSYNLNIQAAGDLTTINTSSFVHDQAVEANYTRYDFSELATYQFYSLAPGSVQAISASLIYPTGTNTSADQNLTPKTAGVYPCSTGSMNGRLTLDVANDSNSPFYEDGAVSVINLATGSVFVVFQNIANNTGRFFSTMIPTKGRYQANYNSGKPKFNNQQYIGVTPYALYDVADSVLTANNMVSIHQDTTDDTTNSGGTMYYDGALCQNLTGNYAVYDTFSTTAKASGTQSGSRYIGQGMFTNAGDWYAPGDTPSRYFGDGICVGGGYDGSTGENPLNGELAEVRIYNRVLTTDEIAVVHRELAYKWGFSLQ